MQLNHPPRHHLQDCQRPLHTPPSIVAVVPADHLVLAIDVNVATLHRRQEEDAIDPGPDHPDHTPDHHIDDTDLHHVNDLHVMLEQYVLPLQLQLPDHWAQRQSKPNHELHLAFTLPPPQPSPHLQFNFDNVYPFDHLLHHLALLTALRTPDTLLFFYLLQAKPHHHH